MKNKIDDLRNHLFETIEALKDEEKPMDLDRAKVISDVAQTIINSAKVEVDLAKAVGGTVGSQFLALKEESRELPRSEPRPDARRAIAGGSR